MRDIPFSLTTDICLLAGLVSAFICMVVIGVLVHVPPSGWNLKITMQVVGFTTFGFIAGWFALSLLLGRLRTKASGGP